jgi:hypothetical protein
MKFVQENLNVLMLFSLTLASLIMYGYNQTDGMEKILIFFAGSFAGYLTNVVGKTLIMGGDAKTSKSIAQEFINSESN